MSPKLHLIMSKHRCPHCVFRKFFIDAGIDCQSLDDIGESATQISEPYDAGDVIFRAGESCDALHVVQSGSVKIEMNTEQGGAHVSGFYLTGEMFGVEGISRKRFPADVVALERTIVCEMKLPKWDALCESYPSLHTSLISELSDAVFHKNNEMMFLHHLRVETRVLIFLRDLLARVRVRRGQSIREVPLPMSNMDIARYLCITPETLSRCLTNLEKRGVIAKRGRSIELLDEGYLLKEAGG